MLSIGHAVKLTLGLATKPVLHSGKQALTYAKRDCQHNSYVPTRGCPYAVMRYRYRTQAAEQSDQYVTIGYRSDRRYLLCICMPSST